MAKFTIPKTVPEDVRCEPWDAEDPIVWHPLYGVCLLFPCGECEPGVPCGWIYLRPLTGDPRSDEHLSCAGTPLTPFARDLLDALRAGG